MSTDTQSATIGTAPATAVRSVRSRLRELLILVLAIGWIAFWGALALVHFERTAVIPTVVTGVGFTLPVVLALFYRYAKRRYEHA